MIKETVKVVLETCSTTGGGRIVGYTTEESTGSLQSYPMDAINPQDGSSSRYILAVPEAVPLLDAAAISALCAEDVRHAALARLSDAELAALGLKR